MSAGRMGRLWGLVLPILATVPVLADKPANLPQAVVRGSLDRLDWKDLREFGGMEAILYRSPDGRRVAAAFQESGKASFTYPFDEFLIVTAGEAAIRVRGGETFTIRKGDFAYFHEGTTVDFDFSADFADVTFLVADHEVRWR